MVTVYDVSAQKLIETAAKDLETKVRAPQWTMFVKTGSQAIRVPTQDNWFHLRMASALRRVYVDGPVGVERLRTVYGTAKKRRCRHPTFKKSGGKVIRTVLQELERMKLITKGARGRTISPEGRKYLDGIAGHMKKEQK